MQATGRLLFGDDGSVGADLGWLWIHEQSWDGWELAQLSATTPPPGTAIPHERSVAHENPAGPTRTSFAEAGFIARHALLAEADPRIALMDDADADLVVVGSTGHRFGPDRLGSTAEWLLRNSPKPTVIARNGQAVHQVLVCADATDASLRAVDGLVKMPWIDDAAIVVLAVDWGREASPELKVGICGEHGGHPSSIRFCHQVGLDYVSCSAPRVPIARLAAAHAVLMERSTG